MERRKIASVDDAAACLAAAAESGLTRAEWARANGVNARSLNAWRVTLDRRRCRGAQSPSLVELVPARVACGVRVRVDRVEVVVEEGFDEALFTRVLRAVLAC
jgi:transposase-like protein